MDSKRFDALVRSLGSGASRRSVLKGFLGLGGAAVLADNADARTDRTRPTIPPPQTPSCLLPKQMCGGDCCDPGKCKDGHCCANTSDAWCAGKCCPGGLCTANGQTCCDPGDQVCGNVCCSSTTTIAPSTTTTAAPACLPVRNICNPVAPACCETTLCSYEANCTVEQGEARCCRPIGQLCSDRCDCCDNSDCVVGRCQLDTGQQCLNVSECSGVDPGCCNTVCRDLDNDVFHCGGCGIVCQSATNPGEINTCIQGSCGVACGSGYTMCGVACVLTDSDENNCGACGNQCAGGETCCFGTCRNLLTDERSCGSCGVLCPGTCCSGECKDLLLDELNCGTCGRNCYLELCGELTLCPNLVTTCCNGACVDLASDNGNCGKCDTVCPVGHSCQGAICLLG